MAHHAQAVGRYVTIHVDEVEYEVFYLRNGQGQPLVCQHAAGSHNHQWRSLLEDSEITRRYDVIAYDLAYHGKSDPPANRNWWESEYRLTADHFMKFVLRFCDALNLERPIVSGVSFGGNLALQLARYHADRFRAVLPIGAMHHSPGFHQEIWRSPRANPARAIPAAMWDSLSPHSPERDRRLVMHHASQGAAAFHGDTYFYSVDHDLRQELGNIDCRACPVVLMSGSYDYLAPPEAVEAYARKIPGSVFIELDGLGHLPMAENYPAFRRYLLEALKVVERKSRVSAA